MKILSILFTVLFFLGFTDVTYATEYTIINKVDNASVEIYLAYVNNHGYGKPQRSVQYIAEPGTCLYVDEDYYEFERLVISLSFITSGNSRTSTVLCSPDHDTCYEANNYEIIYTKPWWAFARDTQSKDYEVVEVDESNSSRNCTSIERWMKIKEHEQIP